MKFIYKLPHGYFPGGAYFKYAPTVNASAWCDNNFLVRIEWKQKIQFYSTPYCNEIRRNGIRLPAVLRPIRTVKGRELRRQGIEVFRNRFLTPRTDGMSNTLTSVQKDNLIMIKNNGNMENLVYYEHPTKEQLLEYFSQRIRIRKMSPREAFRLMDVDDSDIDKIMNAEETVTLKNGTTKTKKAISKTACYKLAGNSIVCSVLYHIFRTMFIPDQPENTIKQPIQPSPFD